MANYTTSAERYNIRMHKIFETARQLEKEEERQKENAMTTLNEALIIVRAAGYRVTQPKSKTLRLNKPGPIFVAHWQDGNITRMSIHTLDHNPDVKRGMLVSKAAYESRTKGLEFPRIMSGHFERDGQVLQSYDGATLAKHL